MGSICRPPKPALQQLQLPRLSHLYPLHPSPPQWLNFFITAETLITAANPGLHHHRPRSQSSDPFLCRGSFITAETFPILQVSSASVTTSVHSMQGFPSLQRFFLSSCQPSHHCSAISHFFLGMRRVGGLPSQAITSRNLQLPTTLEVRPFNLQSLLVAVDCPIIEMTSTPTTSLQHLQEKTSPRPVIGSFVIGLD